MDEVTSFKFQQLDLAIEVQEVRLEGHEADFINPAPIAIRWLLDLLVELRDELEG